MSKLSSLPANPAPALTDETYSIPTGGGAQYKTTLAQILGLLDLVISKAAGEITVTTRAGESIVFKTFDTNKNIVFEPNGSGSVLIRKTLQLGQAGFFPAMNCYSGSSLEGKIDPGSSYVFGLAADQRLGWSNDNGNAGATKDVWLQRAAVGVLAIGSGQKFQVGDAAVAETPTATHTLRLRDSAGVEYKILAVPV